MDQRKVDIAITKEQLAALPIEGFPGRIHVVDNEREAAKALAYLNDQEVVGFDTETRPSFKKGKLNTVALIQISTVDVCFLFRLKKLGFTDSLVEFLENPNVTKIGLSLRDDFLAMHKVRKFEPGGFVDLQDHMAEHEIHDISLQKIYGIIFKKRISKGQRLSNWEADNLTDAQKLYAATDAWATLRIYRYLHEGRFDPSTSPYHQWVDPNQG